MIPVYNFILIHKSNHFDIRIKCHFFAIHRQYACILISRFNSSGLHSGCPVLVIDFPLLRRNTNLFGDNLTCKSYYRNIRARTDWNYSPIDSLRIMADCTQFAVSLIPRAHILVGINKIDIITQVTRCQRTDNIYNNKHSIALMCLLL